MSTITDTTIDAAVPVDGTPSRANTNALLKTIRNELDSSGYNQASATGKLEGILKQDLNDTAILAYGDSTGNNTTEWIYLYAVWLGEQYPAYGVDYYLWNDATGDYNTVVEVQAGTGSNTLSVYNCSVAGETQSYAMGSKYENAVLNIPDVSCIYFTHGHNFLSHIGYTDERQADTHGVPSIMESAGFMLARHQGAGLVIVTQNPRRDDDNYLFFYMSQLTAAGMLNADIADSYMRFTELDKDASLYTDNIHPNAAGTQVYLTEVKKLHGNTGHKSGTYPFSFRSSLLSNSDFALFSSSVPDDWTANNVTCSKDTSIFESANGYSVNLAKTAGGSSAYLSRNFTSTNMKTSRGGWVTLAVRMYIEDGQLASVGRFSMTTNSKSSNTYPSTNNQRDGWHWRILSLQLLPSDTFCSIRIYADVDTGATLSEVKIDRIMLCKGRLPGDTY